MLTFSFIDAKKHGGQVILGGGPLKDFPGYFLQPTVITHMNREMLTTREETFAPMVGLYEFETEEDAIEMANDCDVGLGSFIVTESIPRMWRVSEALEVGMVGVNLGLISACEAPFGMLIFLPTWIGLWQGGLRSVRQCSEAWSWFKDGSVILHGALHLSLSSPGYREPPSAPLSTNFPVQIC